MLDPQGCPICLRSELRVLFDASVGICVNIEGKLRNVGGFSIFICSVNGHVFLVRSADLEPGSYAA
jgi:hypothetical protein